LLEEAFEKVAPVVAQLYLMRREAEKKLTEVRSRARYRKKKIKCDNLSEF
jgi:hypothetical protein